jgi:RimJ/RimL family protein N-acetyltransferase
MSEPTLSVRELQQNDISFIADYWQKSDRAFMESLGVDITKLPAREQWSEMLMEQINQRIEEKKSYCIIWLADDKPIGHSNINKIVFAKEAYMHLHIWDTTKRRKGVGVELVKLTLPYFFNNYKLEKLYCEPYALNPAPNRTLEKVGFEFVKQYITTPGWLNFEQPVNLWQLSHEKFKAMN